MFANQSRLFIPELRRLGFLSEISPDTPKEQIEAEEKSIKMALRATMQAIFDGFMAGLGQGAGALLCGIFIELYNYIKLWQLFFVVALSSLVLHQLCELTRSRWSDTYKPPRGTKAFEIMQLNGADADADARGAPQETNSIQTTNTISNSKITKIEQQFGDQNKVAECC